MDAVTFDLKIGKELELKDLFKKDIHIKETLDPILKAKVDNFDFELYEEYKGIEEEQGFYLTENSLVIYYQEYVYTPHAVGPLEIEVKFDEIKEILK